MKIGDSLCWFLLKKSVKVKDVSSIRPNNLASTNHLKAYLQAIAAHQNLSAEEAEGCFDYILSGEALPNQVAALLMGLRARGECTSEILGAARAVRRRMLTLSAPEQTIDIGGTGGDGAQLYNVSTAASLVVAGCGVPVAKQGGRAVTSLSGAADVLEASGVNLSASFSTLETCLEKYNIAFLSAPRHHPAIKNTAEIRSQLGTRTIFNLLGPLSNPAGVRRHLIGVAERRWLLPFAEILNDLGSEHAWLVHGADGLDEMTTTGPTHVVELRKGKLREFQVQPEDAGLFVSRPEDLRGGDPTINAAALKALLAGAQNAYRNVVLLNTAAALIVAGKAGDLKEGAHLARLSIDSGKARTALEGLIKATNAK